MTVNIERLKEVYGNRKNVIVHHTDDLSNDYGMRMINVRRFVPKSTPQDKWIDAFLVQCAEPSEEFWTKINEAREWVQHNPKQVQIFCDYCSKGHENPLNDNCAGYYLLSFLMNDGEIRL